MNKTSLSGAEVLLEVLHRHGVKAIFGYPGGAVIPIYDALYHEKRIRHYFCRHEQGAAHEADGYARSSGELGVCLATSGPGATNLVTGIMTAHMDSTPMLVITGQVALPLVGRDAFQESDIVGITAPITKNNYLVKSVEHLVHALKEAIYLATTGRPGPVLVDIPKDVQTGHISKDRFEALMNEPVHIEGYQPTIHGHQGQIRKAAKLLAQASRPLLLVGGGVKHAGATDLLVKLANLRQAPVAMTLMGLGSLPMKDRLSVNNIGMHGVVAANWATKEADVVVAIGTRFSDRVASNPLRFCPQAQIIHIDIDPAEVEKNVRVDVPIVGDAKSVLKALLRHLETMTMTDTTAWLDKIQGWKTQYALTPQRTDATRLMAQEVLQQVDAFYRGQAIYVTDVGQHQMWAAQFLTKTNPRHWVTSGGAGTMGFGLPAAIGAQVANPDKPVLLVVGDGGLQMTAHELMLLTEYRLPVKVLLLNNGYLGMVRQWQNLFFEGRLSSVDLSVNPDFQSLAQAYGVAHTLVTHSLGWEVLLSEALSRPEAMLIECHIERTSDVYPMVPSGQSVESMMGLKGYAS